MRSLIIIIIALFSISFNQELDYSEMSITERALTYEINKKNHLVAAICTTILPSSGHLYLNNWKRGLYFQAGKFLSYLAAGKYIEMTSTRRFKEDEYINSAIIIIVLGSIIETYDVLQQTSKYNDDLYKKIFEKEPPKIEMNLYPMHDGAGITFSYSFN